MQPATTKFKPTHDACIVSWKPLGWWHPRPEMRQREHKMMVNAKKSAAAYNPFRAVTKQSLQSFQSLLQLRQLQTITQVILHTGTSLFTIHTLVQ